MLSQKNIDKLCMTGIYRCDPKSILSEASTIYYNPYHSRNWTFKVKVCGGEYLMVDTYWSVSPDAISLSDDNFDKFELLFDMNDVKKYYGSFFEDYAPEDRWIVRLDSGGATKPYKIVRKEAFPVKERVMERILDDIKCSESHINGMKKLLQQIRNDEIDTRVL